MNDNLRVEEGQSDPRSSCVIAKSAWFGDKHRDEAKWRLIISVGLPHARVSLQSVLDALLLPSFVWPRKPGGMITMDVQLAVHLGPAGPGLLCRGTSGCRYLRPSCSSRVERMAFLDCARPHAHWSEREAGSEGGGEEREGEGEKEREREREREGQRESEREGERESGREGKMTSKEEWGRERD